MGQSESYLAGGLILLGNICFYNSLDMCRYNKPTYIARPKLIKVPIKIYSVSFLSLALERSLNLKTDLAAISNPMELH